MKRLFFTITFLFTTSIYSQNNFKNADYSPIAYDSNYQAPYFIDSNRVQKIEAAFPIIENMYTEYAKKNHYPGLAFGIVVDGKLLFSGSTGYSDIENKIPVDSKSMFHISSI